MEKEILYELKNIRDALDELKNIREELRDIKYDLDSLKSVVKLISNKHGSREREWYDPIYDGD